MEVNDWIKIGMANELSFQVEHKHTAAHIGSGSLKVLATPMMIAFMERVARDLLALHLPQGYSSVGVHVDIHHLAPTPLGEKVWVTCKIVAVDSRRVDFAVRAWDAHETVGEGTHQRVVINEERFIKRVTNKQAG